MEVQDLRGSLSEVKSVVKAMQEEMRGREKSDVDSHQLRNLIKDQEEIIVSLRAEQRDMQRVMKGIQGDANRALASARDSPPLGGHGQGERHGQGEGLERDNARTRGKGCACNIHACHAPIS